MKISVTFTSLHFSSLKVCFREFVVPSQPDKKGAANSAVNFGSGLGNFVGPALVSVLAGFGTGVVMYTMAGLYLFSGILVQFLKVPGEK